jgi:hypothetical protein
MYGQGRAEVEELKQIWTKTGVFRSSSISRSHVALVAIGSSTLLIEGKTTAKEADKATSNMYGPKRIVSK